MAAGQLIPLYGTPALTSTGLVAAGAVLSVFNTGTDTLANLYADHGLSTLITNPLTANSAGRFTVQSTVIWADDAQAYDMLLTFPDGSTLTFDNIYVLEPGGNLSGYAPLNSPNFTGVPTAPTPATNDDSTKIATTAYVQNQNYAPIASPAFTGVPTAPTASSSTNSTQIATTAFVQSLVGIGGGSLTPTTANIILPNGAILKSGLSLQSMTNPTTKTITFPAAFPNACIFAGAMVSNPSVTVSTVTAYAVTSISSSAATFLFAGYQSGAYASVPGFYWWALGY